MAKSVVRVDGLREMEQALKELPRATAKNVMRRVLRTAGEPMAEDMRSKAPVQPDSGALRDSIGVGTRLSRRQAGIHRKMFKDDRSAVEMFVGAGALPQAITQEFGTWFHSPQPFARSAWDAGKNQALETIKSQMWVEIEKAARRQARKAARLAKK